MNWWGKDKYWYLLSVILALIVFAITGSILPTLDNKSSFTYHALFFLFTLGAIILLSFSAVLIHDGVRDFYTNLSRLIKILRKRRKP